MHAQNANKLVGSALLFLSLFGCSTNQNAEPIVMSPIQDCSCFEERVDSIRILPLQKDDLHLLGGNIDLRHVGDSWITADYANSRVYRYSEDGLFLNTIGARGRARNEYNIIQNIQIAGDTVIVFSFPNKIVQYSIDGSFINFQTSLLLGDQSYLSGDHILTYYGYLAAQKYRFASIITDKIKYRGLRTKGKVMHYDNPGLVFSDSEHGTVITDSYSGDLYRVSPTSCNKYFSFDFREYSIPPHFFRESNEFNGAKELLTKDVAQILRYTENDNYKISHIIISGPEKIEFVIGVESNGAWGWYSLSSPKDNPLADSFRLLKNNTLVFIIESERLSGVSKALAKKITNIKDFHKEDCDYVVASVYIH